MAESGGNPPVKMLFGKPIETNPNTATSGPSKEATEPLQRPSNFAGPKLLFNKVFGGSVKAATNKTIGSRLAPPPPALNSPDDLSPSESASTEATSPPANCTLICRGVPENLNTKNELKAHFERFGSLKRIASNIAAGSATIVFANHHDAMVAKETGTQLRDGTKITIYWKSQRKQSLTGVGSGNQASNETSAPAARKLVRQTGAAPANAPIPAPPKQSLFGGPNRASSSSLPWVPSHVRVPPGVAKVFTLCGQTAQEKADILEQADKVIYDLMAESGAKREHAIVGTCEDMCPERERYDREFQRRLSRFERTAENAEGYYSVDHKRALKEYARSAADQREPLPYELRTPQALDKTMIYLLREICPMSDQFEDDAVEDWADWYHILWTRTRGIRKDITQQHLVSDIGVSLMERCARFHAFCAERLVEVPSTAGFDQKLNSQNLTKCLQSLKEMYADMRKSKNVAPDEDLPELVNEAEFTGYRILTKLDEGAILTEIERVSATVRFSRPVQFALAVFSAYNRNNYARFFRMFREQATYFEACLMHRYLTLVRTRTLKTILHAYTPNERAPIQVPIADVCSMLCFESAEECKLFLQSHGIEMSSPDMVEFIRMNYYQPETWPHSKRLPAIMASKQGGATIAELINGGVLPEQEDVLKEPATSFDQSGHFIGSPKYRDLLLELLESVQNNLGEQHQQQQPLPTAHQPSNIFGPSRLGPAGGSSQQPAAIQQWPSAAEMQRKQEAELVEKTMAQHALASQIFNEICVEVVKNECREAAFSASLMYKKMLANADPICDELLGAFVKDYCAQIAQNLLNEIRSDVACRNAMTAEITQNIFFWVIDGLLKDISQEVCSVYVQQAKDELKNLVEEIARAEAKSIADYWIKLSAGDKNVKQSHRKRLLRQHFKSWHLQTKQLLSLREYSNRPFPPGPRLSLKEASEAMSYSSKVLADGQVVRVPIVSSLTSPEKSLALNVQAATMASALRLPAEKLEIPSFEALATLVGSAKYSAWAVWKLAVVVPYRYRENQYILRHVESIFKSFPTTLLSHLVCSIALVSIELSTGKIRAEGSNLLRFYVNTDEDAFEGASCLLIMDDILTSLKAIDALEKACGQCLSQSAVLSLSSSQNESFITKYHPFVSNSPAECIESLIKASLSQGKVCSAVTAAQFLQEFLTCKVFAPVKADFQNRQISQHKPSEMNPRLNLALYSNALESLKKVSKGVKIAPEIAAAIINMSNFASQLVTLPQQDAVELFERHLTFEPIDEVKDTCQSFIAKSFANQPLEAALLSSQSTSWTHTLLSCFSAKLKSTFSGGKFGTNSLLFLKETPNNFLEHFQPPLDWLYEAQRVQIAALASRARSSPSPIPGHVPGSTPGQIKRQISATNDELERLESELLAKRLRNKRSVNSPLEFPEPLEPISLLVGTSRPHSSAAQFTPSSAHNENQTPLSELMLAGGGGVDMSMNRGGGGGSGNHLMNNSTFILD